MTFYDLLDWIGYWTVAFGLSAVEWLQRTTEWAGNFFLKARELYNTLWGKLHDLADPTTYQWIKAAIALVQKIGEIFEYRYFWVEEIFTDLVTRWRQALVIWWERLVETFDTHWPWLSKWLRDWIQYATWFFDNHQLKLDFVFVTDWPKLTWLMIDRFEDLFGAFEGHIEGWRTFADDPATAIWNWVKPRLQELAANWMVELW